MSSLPKKFNPNSKIVALLVVFSVVMVGALALPAIFASNSAISFEPEKGTTTGSAQSVTDSNASGGTALKFGTAVITPPADTFQLGTTKPDATNTGVPSDVTLTPYNGDLVITTPNTVIDGKDIYGFVTVKAANVTIKNSRIRGRNVGYTNGGNLITCSDASCTGLHIERCTIHADYPQWWLEAVYGGDYTALRNDISGTVDGFLVRSGSTNILGNYLHDFFFSDQSSDQSGSNPPYWTHNDGIQYRVASGAGPHLAQGNNFYWYPDRASPVDRTAALVNGYGTSYYKNGVTSSLTGKLLWGSGVTVSPDLGPVTGVTITQNWFEGGTSGFQMNALSPAAGPMDLGTVSSNRFGMDQFNYGYGNYQIRYKSGGVIAGLTTNYFDPDAPSVPADKKGVLFTVGLTGGIRVDP